VFVGYPPNCQNTVNSWNLATSVANFNLDEAVTVYPNPSSGKVYVRYQLDNANPVQIEVFNATGVRVAMTDGTAVSGNSMVDLGGMSEGIYLVLITNNGQTATRKVVVKNLPNALALKMDGAEVDDLNSTVSVNFEALTSRRAWRL